jgi:hypothetical protein
MTALLEKPGIILSHQNNHGQNNQDFLPFLNLADAQTRKILEKQPRTRRTSIKRATSG